MVCPFNVSFFINFYHTAIFFVYNLIINYLIVVVDNKSMVVND